MAVMFTCWIYIFTIIYIYISLSLRSNRMLAHSSTPLHNSSTLREYGIQRHDRSFDEHVSPGLAELCRHLMWASPDVTCRRFRLSFRRSPSSNAVALLLLCSGIEPNPGPLPVIEVGCLDVRSAVHKGALLHDVISHNDLDVLALTDRKSVV